MNPIQTYFLFSSKKNENLQFKFPSSLLNIIPKSIAIKDFSYDNCITNIDGFTIYFFDYEDSKESFKDAIHIPYGLYDRDDILHLINTNLMNSKLYGITFSLNKHNSKIEINNESKYIIEFDEPLKKFLKMKNIRVYPNQKLESYDKIEIMNPKHIYIIMKNIKYGIATNLNINQDYQIIHTSSLNKVFGKRIKIKEIELMKFEILCPILFAFDFKIVDENGIEINLENINILFSFEARER